MLPSRDGHLLECRDISYTGTFTPRDSCLTRLYRPPSIAHFLKGIRLCAKSGEVHGVLGSSGSGKTTLLDVICTKAKGEITGTVVLDHQTLTTRRFSRVCVRVSLLTRYPGSLPLRSMLFYHSKLCIGGSISSEEIASLVEKVLSELDLSPYADDEFGGLSESARRRATVAMALLRDPLVVVVDDVVRGLDPLPAFQLISCLNQWAKRRNRIVLVSIRSPRSDIYQLLNRITVLYYGEVFYSGRTKELPDHFSKAGFLCPSYENPAVYYLSLASVDRENEQRNGETHEQAIQLVSFYRLHGDPSGSGCPVHDSPLVGGSFPMVAGVALCHLDRPPLLSRLWTLIRRSCLLLLRRWVVVLLQLCLLPAAIAIMCFTFSVKEGSPSLPFSSGGFVWFLVLTSASSTLFICSSNFHYVRSFLFIESSDGLYSPPLALVAHSLIHSPLLFFSSLLSTGLLILIPFSPFSSAATRWSLFLHSFPLFLLISSLSFMLSLFSMSFLLSPSSFLLFSFSFLSLSLLLAGGWLLHLSLPPSIPILTNCWHYMVKGLTTILVPAISKDSLVKNCTSRTSTAGDFCRWPSTSGYLHEVFRPSSPKAESLMPSLLSVFSIQDWLLLLFMLSLVALATVLVYALPRSPNLVEKFKYR